MRGTSSDSPAELALVLHFHQPVGNFDHVFEKVTGQCYAPLLELLAEFGGVRTHLHLNGILLEWFDRHRPDLVERLGALVRSGSVELLTGGLREPILSVLPEADAVGQVVALSDDLERRFGQRPEGGWLTERVFEPRLPTVLHRAGVGWVTLDDLIFHWAGVDGDDLAGPRVTDDAGHPLVLFPAAKSLRYTIPFRPHDETFEILRSRPARDGVPPLWVYADDAEKFGEWPGTHDWVFTKGWLRTFLERLEESDGVRTVHLSERLRRHHPRERIYPPTASYPELTVWAMPTRARARMEGLMHALEEEDPQGLLSDLRGGHWRGFLAKYPEVHRLHKRMLRVSRRLAALADRGVDPARLESARQDLYRGQCNDAYWHGAFGGVYLPHLRRAVEGFLIRAERTLESVDPAPAGRTLDFHADGSEEIELTTARGRVIVDPVGGAVLTWDLPEACENWVSVMQRHEEPFHADLREGRIIRVDEEGLPLDRDEDDEGVATIHGAVRVKPGVEPEDLQVDRHTRVAGLLRAAPAGTVAEDPRAVEELAAPLGAAWEFALARGAAACTLHTVQAGLRVEQVLELDGADRALGCTLRVEPVDGPRVLFSEWNLFVGWSGDDLECDDGSGFGPAPAGTHQFGERALKFRGGGERALEISALPGTSLGWAPVHTVSSSEAGLEKIGQGTCFLFSWAIEGPVTLDLRLVPSAPARGDDPPGR